MNKGKLSDPDDSMALAKVAFNNRAKAVISDLPPEPQWTPPPSIGGYVVAASPLERIRREGIINYLDDPDFRAMHKDCFLDLHSAPTQLVNVPDRQQLKHFEEVCRGACLLSDNAPTSCTHTHSQTIKPFDQLQADSSSTRSPTQCSKRFHIAKNLNIPGFGIL